VSHARGFGGGAADGCDVSDAIDGRGHDDGADRLTFVEPAG
jgi:hypothetical protein